MMRYFFVPVIIILVFSLQGLGQWDWEYPIPQGNTLNELFFKNSSGLGFAIGDHGAILKTENLGITWSTVDSMTTSALYSGCFIGNQGYIVGDDGLILKTTDNISWNRVSSGSHYRLNSIIFADEINGYIGGYKGQILKSIDGGESWQELNSGTLNSIYAGHFFSTDQGIYVGDSGLIIKTNNAGSSWSQPNSGTQLPLLDIYFPSGTIGYITGKKGIILKTEDAGETWSDVSYEPMKNELNSVYFYNETIGYAAGAYGVILQTENGGASWNYLLSGTDLAIRSIKMTYNNDTVCDSLIVCGEYGLMQRSDSCGYWSNIASASSHTFNTVYFTADMHGYAIGGNPFTDIPFILTAASPDSPWVIQAIDTIAHYVTDICFPDTAKGYISGREGSIYKTADGGNNWVPLKTGTDRTLYSIFFTDTTLGFAAGENGTIIRTFFNDTSWTDTTWVKLTSGTTNNLYSLFFFDTIRGGYAVGENGTIRKIKNKGNSISTVNSGTDEPLYDVYFPTDSVGFVVGYAGKILKIKREMNTETVINISSGVTTPLNKIFFPNPDTGYIAGEGGVILKTTDRGETWYPQYTGTSNSLRGMHFINNSTGFAVGAGVTIIKTINGGGGVITPGIAEKEIVENPLKLYPNPGSDYTHLEYQLDEGGQVQIGLFDLSGRKIKDYFNSQTDSGIQKIMLDISNIDTGIYIVLLQTKNRIYAKKLIVF